MTKVTIYKNVSDTSSQSYYDFSDVLKIIKSGDSNLRQNTLYLRSIVKTNPTEYANLKKQFPMVASSGEFKYRNSNPSSLLSYSNIVVADLDWNDPDSIDNRGKEGTAYSICKSDERLCCLEIPGAWIKGRYPS